MPIDVCVNLVKEDARISAIASCLPAPFAPTLVKGCGYRSMTFVLYKTMHKCRLADRAAKRRRLSVNEVLMRESLSPLEVMMNSRTSPMSQRETARTMTVGMMTAVLQHMNLIH